MTAPSAATLRLHQLTSDYVECRIKTRAAIASLSGVVPALRSVVRDAQEDLRRRLEAERARVFNRSVLVVEDIAEQQEIMVSVLKMALNVPVYGAANSDEAMIAWEAYKPCAVVVDLRLGPHDRGDHFINDLPHGVRAVLISGVADLLTLYTAAARCHATPLPRSDVRSLPDIVRGMLDAVHPPLWCRSTADHFIDVSHDLAAMLGYTRREMAGMAWRDIVHPDDLPRSEAQQRKNSGRGVFGWTQRMRRSDGAYVALTWDVAPVTDGVLYAVARVA
jgi:PAS domain S-box-containing protein